MSVLSIIAAIGANNELGRNNDLLWRIPADLKRFKQITSGHTVIMGRKTYESIGCKPLKNRKNVVITSQIDFEGNGAVVAHSVDEAIDLTANDGEVFILGGGRIYALFLEKTDKMYLTHVHDTFEADVYFPDFDKTEWEVLQRTDIDDDEKAGLSYSFVDYKRILK